MKKIVLAFMLMLCIGFVQAQTTYYWVGNPGDSINVNSNWNTVLDGSGSSRPASAPSPAADILIFDGSNFGTTGFINVVSTAGINCLQLKFINGAKVNLSRITSGTSTINIAGEAGEDFVIDAGCALTIPTTSIGSLRFAMAATTTGRVSGSLTMTTPQQARFDNTTSGTKGAFIFTSGSSFTTNITASSTSYAFGSSSQSSEGWVVFQAGSHLYYDGGYSPNGSGANFSAIDMQPGCTWHHRANQGGGNFFNRKNYGNVIVENNATLTAMGSVYSIENLTITAGSSFVTHTSGQTVVLGNLTVDGSLTAPTGSTNNLVLAGSAAQTVSGSGTIDVGGLIVGNDASVVLNKNINVQNAATVYGKINFNNYQITGAGTFSAKTASLFPSLTGNSVAGNFFISSVSGFSSSYIGSTISGNGIAPNTTVVSYNTTSDSVYLSQPTTATATGTSFTFGSQGATLETANANGFDAASGSVIVSGDQTYHDGINYIINAATAKPFGISTGSTATNVNVGDLTFNAPATTNSSVHVTGTLQLNTGKVTIRPLDTVYLLNTATLSGNFNASNYFVTDVNTTTGAQGILRVDGVSAAKLLPVGTVVNYLPATLTPASSSDFAVAVFEGITNEGTPNGSVLASNQKLTKVDAVWNLDRINGTGDADLQVQWPQSLEGTAFTTFADSEIGILVNQNPGWSLPVGTGDNASNTASSTFSTFGAFSVGAKPPAQPFIYNSLPDKTYGDPDFDPGALSLNTTNPIVYTSSNLAVATIVNGKVHITGVGTTTITASQTSDGFYPDVAQSQSLMVGKAGLTIKADNLSKPEGDPNPVLTVTYTGFVNGETRSVLTTPVSINTTAITSSPAGAYPITVSGATATNYTITFESGTLTITPRQNQTITFNALPTKTYGNADFAAGATSTNNTIPVTYTSSNTAVATIVGNNIHIVGAGTTTVTASQAGNAFYFPAAPVSRTLVVNKANLTVKVADTVRNFGEQNPPFIITYSGFVLGETISSLPAQPSATTTATTTSAPGYYAIVLDGGNSNNYNFVYTNGRMTILPATGSEQPNLQAFMSSSSMLTVRVFSAVPDLADIVLYDMTGKPVLKKNVFLPKGFISVNISVSGMSAGLYSVVVNGQTIKLKKNVTIAR